MPKYLLDANGNQRQNDGAHSHAHKVRVGPASVDESHVVDENAKKDPNDNRNDEEGNRGEEEQKEANQDTSTGTRSHRDPVYKKEQVSHGYSDKRMPSLLMLGVVDHTYTTMKYNKKKPRKKPEMPLVIFQSLKRASTLDTRACCCNNSPKSKEEQKDSRGWRKQR